MVKSIGNKDTVLANREEGEVTKNTSFYPQPGSRPHPDHNYSAGSRQGLIDLDENINRYIPFKIVNPIYPNAVVTMRMLLSHTAGLADNTALLSSMYVAGDSDADLKEFLTEYLLPGGANYSAANFTTSRPGKTYEYSRVGIALAGFIYLRMRQELNWIFIAKPMFLPVWVCPMYPGSSVI
ncbi:MAG: serine hydrolase [Bacteroidia bacterium]